MKSVFLNRRNIVVLGICILLLQMTGCASTGKIVRASEGLETQNSMNEIALIGGAMILRPRMGGKEAVLSLTDSKAAIEIAVPKLKTEMEKKGYRVVYAQPVGVGYKHPSYKENWVFTFDNDGREQGQRQIQDGSPAFEYPALYEHELYRKAVREEYERVNIAISKKQPWAYLPKQENLQTIQKVTGGDTICLVRSWGHQFSSARKAGDVGLDLLASMVGATRTGGYHWDHMETLLVCSSPDTGKVIWHASKATEENPVEPPEDHFKETLALFPPVATPLSKECKMTDKVRSLYRCIPQ